MLENSATFLLFCMGIFFLSFSYGVIKLTNLDDQ